MIWIGVKSAIPESNELNIVYATRANSGRFTGLDQNKLCGMAQRGEIPASKIGTYRRFTLEEIDQRMKAHSTGKEGIKK